jgi:hypothetical protein
MVWTPPVNIPDLSQQKDYAGQLFGMLSSTGEAFRQNRRDKVGDAQWAQEQERLSTAQALAQSNADRNYALELQKFQADEAAGAEFFSPQPIYNPDTGEWGLAQPSKAGGAASQVVLPEGFQYRPTTQNLDLGPNIQPTARGVPVGPGFEKDIAEENRQKAIGTGQGEAANALPVIEQNADFVLRSIDSVIQDPDLARVTGGVGGLLPTIMDTDPEAAYRVQSRIDQLLGQTFLLAYDKIRGAGQITEYESQKASQALNRLQTQTMSDEDYLATLNEFRNEVIRLVELARSRAAGGQQGPVEDSPVYTTPGGNTFRKIGP